MPLIQNNLGSIPDEKQFIPHITIARLLDIKREDLPSYLAYLDDFLLLPFEIDHFVLFLSLSPSSDTPYIVKRSWALQE